MRRSTCLLTIAIAGMCLAPGAAVAQPLGDQLATLLGTQAAILPNGGQDRDAASATVDSITGLLSVEMTNLPATSSSGGFVYRLNPTLGTVERASQSFGPFFTERATRIGARQLAMGLAYQSSSFSTLQGADLTTGRFSTNAVRIVGTTTPINVDTLRLDLDARSITGMARYGISDALEVGLQVPIVNVRFAGVRVNSTQGQTTFRTAASGSASGLGDMTMTARYRVLETAGRGIALGTDLRLPTGDSRNLMGSGSASVRTMIIGSVENRRWSGHANAGLGAGGASSEVFWGGAVTFEAASRVTVVGELFGRRLQELHRLTDQYQVHPLLSNVETMRWVAQEGGVTASYAVSGVKWNVTGSMVLNANLLMRLSDVGLRARVTPTISMDYSFQGLSMRR